MNKKILITGAKGFLGSHVSRHFKSLGYETYGVGNGSKSGLQDIQPPCDFWIEGAVSKELIKSFGQEFSIIIHCAGSGSVNFSLDYPYEDYDKTVNGTVEILEYMRVCNKTARLIYPSSPAVQGEQLNAPIKETDTGEPSSPYGYNKKIAEKLCTYYSDFYDLNISILRLFSVYGIGLKKQLLWDACKKMQNAPKEVIFWGTGEETRDFIHVEDVLSLMHAITNLQDKFLVINGGTGSSFTVRQITEMIKDVINPEIMVKFADKLKYGNPSHYCADTEKMRKIGFTAKRSIAAEITNFVSWAMYTDD